MIMIEEQSHSYERTYFTTRIVSCNVSEDGGCRKKMITKTRTDSFARVFKQLWLMFLVCDRNFVDHAESAKTAFLETLAVAPSVELLVRRFPLAFRVSIACIVEIYKGLRSQSRLAMQWR